MKPLSEMACSKRKKQARLPEVSSVKLSGVDFYRYWPVAEEVESAHYFRVDRFVPLRVRRKLKKQKRKLDHEGD